MILTKGNITKFNSDNFVESRIESDKLASLLLIVPTNRKLRDLKKKIISSFNGKVVSVINIETITTLTTKLLNESKSFIPLSEAATTVLLKETAEELNLSYFAKYLKGIPVGTLDKIKNVISEYKRHGILPSTLEREADKLEGGEKLKALDIASIYKLFLEKCKTYSALEIGDIYNSILELEFVEVQKVFSEIYANVDTVFMDGFDEFTNPEIIIIDILSDIVNSNLIINFDYYSNNENIFSHLTETYATLNERGYKKILDSAPANESSFRNKIGTKLFKEIEQKPTDKFIGVLNKTVCLNRRDEVEVIARQIKKQILEESIKPEKICVVFNIVHNYSNTVRDVFSKYGIPFNLTDRIPLKTSPPIIATISLLELAENDFYYYDLVRVLTNGFFEFKDVNLNNLLSVSSELKIIGGQQNWESSINDAITLLQFDNDILEGRKRQLLSNYKKALEDIKYLSSICRKLKRKQTANEFISNFKKILLELRLPHKVLEDSTGKEEEFIKAITVLLQTFSEILLLSKNKNEDGKYNLQFYLDQIRTIANWARFNTKEKSDYGVLITSVNEIRGLNFDYLYLGGMCDGDFPTKYSPEIFFSGSFQKKELIHQTEERYHFYQTLSAWNKKLFLTVPQKNNETELVESTFVKDLEKLFKFNNIDTKEESNILSKEELQIAIGKKILSSKDLAALKIDYNYLEDKGKISNLRKLEPFGDNIYSGYIGNETNVAELLSQISQKEFSASQLETFAKCPFKYFSERILKLEPIKEPTDEAEPIELGNVLHSILYDFYSKVISEKIPLNKVGTKEFLKLKKILFGIANEKIQKLNLNSPVAFFEKEKILGIDNKEENSILYKFLLKETNNDTDYIPSFFEFSFGKFQNEKTESISSLKIGEMKLRGKIDRIDIDECNNSYNIVDYKLSGRKPTVNDFTAGLSLQLPVYLMAGKTILEEIENKSFVGDKMIIYSLDYKDKNFGPIQVKSTKKRKPDFAENIKENEKLIDGTKEKITEYYQKIKNGKFNLSELENREEKVCRYCNFQSFCRVKEVFEV